MTQQTFTSLIAAQRWAAGEARLKSMVIANPGTLFLALGKAERFFDVDGNLMRLSNITLKILEGEIVEPTFKAGHIDDDINEPAKVEGIVRLALDGSPYMLTVSGLYHPVDQNLASAGFREGERFLIKRKGGVVIQTQRAAA